MRRRTTVPAGLLLAALIIFAGACQDGARKAPEENVPKPASTATPTPTPTPAEIACPKGTKSCNNKCIPTAEECIVNGKTKEN